MRFSRTSRRAFLQGASGFSLAVPFLPSLMPTRALAAVDRQPMRFVMIYNRYGRNASRWFTSTLPLSPSADGSYRWRPLSDIPGDLSPILGPSFDVPLRKKMAIVQGLNCMTAEIAHNAWFATTGSARPPVGGTGFGYSIDAVLEESSRFYATAPMVGAIRTAVDSEANGGSWSYSSKSGVVQHLAAEWNVTSLYDRFFNPTTVQGMKARNDRVNALVTNEVFGDYKRAVTGRRISSQDRIRLDNYMTLLSQIQTKLGAPVISCSKVGQATLGPPAALDDYDKIQAAAMDMEVAALACGMTKIVMHGLMQYLPSMPAGRNDYNWHADAHNGQKNGDNNKWHAAKVAELAKRLDAITEADGNTLLDS
jgi:hypothetical protein